ncbi:MAG: D-alanyl-D-alanine carboxypeptidase/D-alanyl-D-alanine-endopeptidase [Verrucomicrobia bacterium]|nr:D-alanyl-D-alanine carboxypeptidase/D-alanyl-D-alanine-endopeptidase [Verrucomicrobiota bacterium]NBU10290.1 D-alanyl-D-alanine carboxypeptidase/D-alanyl-D-alanine-endopeptidase [Pseudomonadota bacterium]NDB76746.1 D-alanyl-D-alanine carboxypeptidase/D-alanyl-D-alanine-endopeptidase [Verrucomicrobiota bacterium]NDF00007.1 D-alanyl-D-alanine carboxypeptidase/D-alanyl-D-alanine-endopeptidase [Verrucomicrobiota bacterium]
MLTPSRDTRRTDQVQRPTSNVQIRSRSDASRRFGPWPLGLGLWTFLLFASAFSAAAAPFPTNAIPTLAALRSNLTARVEHPRLAAAQLGVKVVSLDTGKTLFEHDAGKLLKPASNAKLYTGALALDRLGPQFRIRTSCYAAAKPDANGTLTGDLTIYGRGDFSMAARFHGGDYTKSLEPLVDALAAAGIKRITGDLVGDESFFRGPPYGSAWTWDDLNYYYGAEVSALTHEDNVVDLVFKPAALGQPVTFTAKPATQFLKFINRTTTVASGGKRSIELYRPLAQNNVYLHGSLPADDKGLTDAMPVPHPAEWFLMQLIEALAKRGIHADGKWRTRNWLDAEAAPVDYGRQVEVAFTESRPVSELVEKMMKPSQNLYAQLLLLQVGARTAKPGQTTEEAGLAEMQKFLAEAGVKRGSVLLEEGSGLSRGCLLMPEATVQLLRHMDTHPAAAAYRASLPIAGVDGSLKSRFTGTAAARNLLAKTGSLRYVSSLSGHVTTAAKERLVFSIMLNAYTGTAVSSREVIDELAVLLANFSGKSQ